MAISFTEKRGLQKAISSNLAALAAGNLSFTEKRNLQKGVTDAFAKLNEKVGATTADVDAIMPLLKQFVGQSQLSAIGTGLRGEEGQFFKDKLIEISKIITTMPATHGTEGQGDSAVVFLHYFKGGSDWYITEKDMETEQLQAFGYAILNGDKQMAELGYINISELIQHGVELDMYWKKQSLGDIKGTEAKPDPDNFGAPTVASIGTALEARGWKPGTHNTWTISNAEAPGFTGSGRYLASGTDADGGNTGWILVDYWDKKAWVPVGGSVSLTGNTVEDVVHAIETMIYEHERSNKGGGNQKLADLIAGQYNTLEPLAFLGVLKDISTEINDFEPLKEPAIKYIEANQDKAGAIMESAFQQAFGKLWGDSAAAEQMILEAAGRTRAMLMPVPASPSSSPIMVEGGDGAPLKITIEIDGDFTEPATFRDRIQVIESAKAGEEINIRINSNGGNTHSAQAFYTALLKTKARTKAVIINAYSSGSIVAMSCDEIELTPFCSMMIHNASGGSGGKIGDMAGYATFKSDYFAEWYAQLYAGFLTEEELKDVAKGQDTWLKEAQIRERLQNWKPIRERLQADGSVAEA